MGIKYFSSSSLEPRKTEEYNPQPPLPKADNYQVVHYLQKGEYLLLWLNYRDCTNFEGDKILLFQSTLPTLLKQKYIDPHFSDTSKYIHPIARFLPTYEGWQLALNVLDIL